MPSKKKERQGEDIKRELAAIIRELKDPRVAGKLLTVVRVEMAQDLSYGKVYVSSMNGLDDAKDAVAALTHAQGLIRRELANRLHLRKAPELKFIADDSVREAQELFAGFYRLQDKKDDEND